MHSVGKIWNFLVLCPVVQIVTTRLWRSNANYSRAFLKPCELCRPKLLHWMPPLDSVLSHPIPDLYQHFVAAKSRSTNPLCTVTPTHNFKSNNSVWAFGTQKHSWSIACPLYIHFLHTNIVCRNVAVKLCRFHGTTELFLKQQGNKRACDSRLPPYKSLP